MQALAEAAVEAQLRGLQAVVGYEWSRRWPAHLGDSPDVYARARAAGRFEPFAYFRRARRHLIDPHTRRSPRYRKALRQGAAPDEALETLHADAAFIDSLCSNLTRLEAGLVALDPTTGHVLAWVGGRDFARDQYDKVALARRQPGSTFKPFVYAAALELGYSPDDQRVDIVRTYQTSGPDKTWTPTNADGEASGDTLTLPADSLRLLAASDTIPPAWRLGDVEGVLRRAVSRSLLADTARIALANTAHADTTRRVPFLTPLDTTRRHPAASPRSRSDTDLEQTMRRLLFPDEPAEKDSSDTRNSATWRDQE